MTTGTDATQDTPAPMELDDTTPAASTSTSTSTSASASASASTSTSTSTPTSRPPPFNAPAPRLVDGGFKDGRVYQTKDDPDRMKVKHKTPKFVKVEQKKRKIREKTEEGAEAAQDNDKPLSVDPDVADRIVVEELIGGEKGVPVVGGGFAKVLYNVLSVEECLELIAMGSDKGWSPALVNIGFAQQFLPEVRDHSRCIVDDVALTDEIWSRIAPYIPEVQHRRRVRGLNDRLRLLCYHRPGQKFEGHRDGNFTRPKHHLHAGDMSFVTVQVYLNEDFTGGATTFLLKNDIPYQPVTGSVLLFSQDLLHEGSALESGIKYTLRTDVMYKPREAESVSQSK